MQSLADAARQIMEVAASWKAGGFRDADVLGDLIQPCDRCADWVTGNNNYVVWKAVAHHFRPNVIGEIGTRFGYSLRALSWGVVSPDRMTLYVWDAELDADVEPLKVMEAHFRARGFFDLHVNRVNTRSLSKLDLRGGRPIDLGSIDGDHSRAGSLDDLRLMSGVLRPGGVMLVDDCNPGTVSEAVSDFCRETGAEQVFLPTLRGVCLVRPVHKGGE